MAQRVAGRQPPPLLNLTEPVALFTRQVPLSDLTARYGQRYKLVLVGDAMMHPLELFERGGSIDFWYGDHAPGIECLRRLADHYERAVWLNPERPRFWTHTTLRAIAAIFAMFPLTLDGLKGAVDHLTRGRRPPPSRARAI